MPDEKNQNKDAGNSAPPDASIEEYPLSDLETLLESSDKTYYCVDAVWADRSKRKLIDPRSLLSASIVRNMYVWGLSKNQIIRVTTNPDSVDDLLDETSKNISHFAGRLHHYLVKIFSENLPSYKTEIQGIGKTAVEMLDGVFSDSNIENVTVGPSDLRPFTSYYDHLVNTAVFWLAAFAAYNRNNKNQAGAIEVWRTKNKPEMTRITAGHAYKTDFATYYDIYDRDTCPADLEDSKKADLSLVLSGFYAALFHDISFLREPAMLISRKGEIDDKLKAHPDESNKILKEKLSILSDERPLTRSVIKNHHEYIDGSGYPAGRKDEKIHLFAQLLSIVDLYDEYSTRFNRSTIIRFMARGAGRIFDGALLRSFLGVLRPFDTGERVDVFEGKTKEPVLRAEVLDSRNKFRPRIRIIEVTARDHPAEPGKVIDLSSDENVIYNI